MPSLYEASDRPRVIINTNEIPSDDGNNVVMPAPKEPDESTVKTIFDKLLGLNGQERYQLWPEKMVREGLSAAHDAMTGEIPQYEVDPNTGDVHTSPQMIQAGQAMSALAGTGGLAGVEEGAGAALGSTPFLRPALKYGEKLYKGKEGQQHLDLIPPELYPEFQRQALNGDDISHWNFGFMNHKGQFLDREKALQYGIDNGILNPQDAKFGALTSTLMSDSSKPGTAINALAKTNNPEWNVKGFENSNWFHGTTHDFDKFSTAKGNPENYLGKYPHFSSSPSDASANYAGHGPDLTSRIESRADEIAQSIADKKYGGVMGDNYGKIMTEAKAKAAKELAGPHEGAVIPANLKLNNPISLVDSKPTWLDFTPKMNKDGDFIGDSVLATKFYNSLKKQGEKYHFNPDDVMASVGDHLYGEVRASDLDKALRNSEALMSAENNKGKLVSSDVISNIYKDLGFDGIVMDAKAAFPHMKDIPEGTLHAAPLKRNTVQSKLTGKTLFSDTSKPGAALAAVANTNKPFYSAVENAIAAAKQPKADAQQWLSFLKNQPGVKQEELQHLGLDKLQGPITKDDLLKAVQEGQPQIKEVVKGGITNKEDIVPDKIAQNQYKDAWDAYTKELNRISNNGTDIAAMRSNEYRNLQSEMDGVHDLMVRDTIDRMGGLSTPTKYHSYQLPGGENYREMLLTLPNDKKFNQTPLQIAKDLFNNQDLKSIYNLNETQMKTLQKVLDKNQDDLKNSTYKSSHWDEPNVLAHIRMNDRNIDGKKTLHLEEIQSDWHQAGRKHGYGENLKEGWRFVPQEDGQIALYTHPKSQFPEGMYPDKDSAIIRAKELGGYNIGVPDAPFKKTWDELALKKAITEAVKNGYDQISWTPGEAQAARYDLSKQISTLKYNPETNHIIAFDKNGNQAINKLNVEPKDLSDIVGKDVADKLMNAEVKDELVGGSYKVLSGQDLKVGGQGMKSFYDKMLVDKMNAIGKKYGAKVEKGEIRTKSLDDLTKSVYGKDETFKSLPSELKDKILNMSTGKHSVHTFPITPELRNQVLTKGFPLFSMGLPIYTPISHNPFKETK